MPRNIAPKLTKGQPVKGLAAALTLALPLSDAHFSTDVEEGTGIEDRTDEGLEPCTDVPEQLLTEQRVMAGRR